MVKGKVIDKISGQAIHIAGSDLDTDRIIPARFLKTIHFEDLALGLFHDDRRGPDGKLNEHPLNLWPQAKILIVDQNFGCGSSREHAPQALKRSGIEAIIGLSFGDIFQGNSHGLGLPCLTVSTDSHRQLTALAQQQPFELRIELDSLTLYCEKIKPLSCQLSRDAQSAFLNGSYDPLHRLLAKKDEIAKIAESLPQRRSLFLG